MKIHIVQKGDTLWKIAKKYGVNFEELKKMNTQLSNPDMIMPGMKIKVPGSGGSIKKEAPMGGVPEAKIKMGAKKEMPIAEHPFAKEKPITMPVAEAPKEIPVKEVPKKQVPIEQPPAPQIPKVVVPVPEVPKVAAPKAEAPKEVPTKPFMPKMPKPIMPEIDINNYYMMNMANLSAQQPAAPQLPKELPKQLPKQPPQLPPKPTNILPQVKPIAVESPEAVESESSVHIQQGGYYQTMYPYQPNCFYPVSPVMPGTGFAGGYPQAAPYSQVQGAQMAMPQMPMQAQMPMQMPMQAQMPMQMPHYGLAGVESPAYEESSSMYMHQMPHSNPSYVQPHAAQMPAPVMGAEMMAQHQHQLPLQPTHTAPAMQPAYDYSPAPCPTTYPAQMMPISPVMPGSGFCGPYGYPQMAPAPQVMGVAHESPGMAQMPLMPTEAQMPQMPVMPSSAQTPLMPSAQMPAKPIKGAEEGCGCGAGAPYMAQGAYGPGYGGPGMYEMPAAPMYGGAPYGGMPMGYGAPGYGAPYSPYGYGPMGGQPFGMPRGFEESSDYEG